MEHSGAKRNSVPGLRIRLKSSIPERKLFDSFSIATVRSHAMKHIVLLIALAAGFAWTTPMTEAQTNCASGSGPSSRGCLIAIADQYFAALAAHDPAKAPLATNIKVSVNGPSAPVNAEALNTNALVSAANAFTSTASLENFSKTVNGGPASFKIYVPDPVSQEIGGIAMMQVKDKPTEIAFYLKVENGRITEAHHVLVPIDNAAALANLTKPRTTFLTAVPSADRLTRDDLRLYAYTFYSGKDQSAHSMPHADNCVRQENGMPTAGTRISSAPSAQAAPSGRGGRVVPVNAVTTPPACGAQLTTLEISYIDSINLRRICIADPETGLVFTLTFNFISNVGGEFTPFPFAAAHINKVETNRVRDIEAMGFGPGPQGAPPASKNAPIKSWSDFTR